MPEKLPIFEPKARIILQLGDQLIRSESVALLEIIKNAYDACASKVTISMKNVENKEFGEIVIEDDGFGMTADIIKKIWLQPGTTYKKEQIENKKFNTLCNRVPLGEKGIGRFGVHKLGTKIELISKSKDSDEAHFEINWENFDNDKLLREVTIDVEERKPEVFKNGTTGTRIIIRKLRKNWTRGAIRELYRAINSLNSPFQTLDSFNVLFKIDRQDWITGLLKFEDIKDNSLYSSEVVLKGNEIVSFNYEFTPWASMPDLKAREHHETDILMSKRVYDEKQKKKVLKDIDLSLHKIGTVRLKLLIFDLDHYILSLGQVDDRKGLKDYLKSNGGIRVYRDGVRVYDYGEPGNDWLNLDIDRVNFPTARISNNIVIGAIQLDRLASKDLEEKTNREGFIENDAYQTFFDAIRFTLGRIITQRNIDKDKIRNYYNQDEKKKPIPENLDLLKEKIDAQLTDSPEKVEILEMITEISADYKTISEVYIRSASAGLSLSIVIHEIEKIIQELIWVVEETKASDTNSDRIKSLTWHLGKLVDGYSGLIRRRSKKESDLKSIITSGIWNIEFRLKAHDVEIVRGYEKFNGKAMVKCSEGLIIGTIVNIIDNSIWWLNYGRTPKKKLYISLSDEQEGYLTILIADNGPGFSIPPEEMIRPFISNKEGGIGIGLHIADEIMKSHGGKIIFPDHKQFNIPKDFESGAIVGLAFKTGNQK